MFANIVNSRPHLFSSCSHFVAEGQHYIYTWFPRAALSMG